MGVFETLGEILEFAVGREVDSSEFYRGMAEGMEKAEVLVSQKLFQEVFDSSR